MKILTIRPNEFVSESQLDISPLGNHVRAIDRTALSKLPHGIVLLGFADDTGIKNVGGKIGASEGPVAIRKKLYRFTSGAPSTPIYDLGDLQASTSIEETHQQAAQLVSLILASGHEPLVLGGGHDFGFPHALGLLQATPSIHVVNIDAHLDVRPYSPQVTSGSPWRLLADHPLFAKSFLSEFGLQTHCNSHSLLEYAHSKKFSLHWWHNLTRPIQSYKKLLSKQGKKPIIVSFDIDSVRWADAPGCSAPQSVGFSAEQALELAKLSGKNPAVRSFGLFELCPKQDPDGRTASLAAKIILSYLEGRGAWNRKSIQQKNRKQGKMQ